MNLSRFLVVIATVISVVSTSNAQEQELKGQILSSIDMQPMLGSHVINLNTVRGATTNEDGLFSIPTSVNDTVMISYVGFQTIKLRVTQDLLNGNELEIVLYEKVQELDETVVKSHDLIGVLEIDIKNAPKNEYNRIHIDGLPQLYEIGAPQSSKFRSPLDAAFHPVDYMYNMFEGNRTTQQVKKIEKGR